MKNFLLISTLFGAFAVNAQDKKPEDVMKLNTEKIDFGKIKQGVPVSDYFLVTNTTDKPLIIENVSASCGCTTPEWSKEPVMAGSTTKIKVGFNAAAPNHFDKDVFIKIAGVSQQKVVKITGDVLDAAAYDAYVKGTPEAKVQTVTKVQGAPKAPGSTKVQAATKVKVKSTAKKTKVKTEKTK